MERAAGAEAVVATRAAVGHGRDVSPPARKSRLGLFAFLALLVALVGAYLGNCFQGLGLGAGTGAGVKKDVKEGAAIAREIVGESADAAARARVIVEGERCRLGDETRPRSCDAVCKDLGGGAAEIQATTGAQRTVDALRTCLQGRGVKVTVIAD